MPCRYKRLPLQAAQSSVAAEFVSVVTEMIQQTPPRDVGMNEDTVADACADVDVDVEAGVGMEMRETKREFRVLVLDSKLLPVTVALTKLTRLLLPNQVPQPHQSHQLHHQPLKLHLTTLLMDPNDALTARVVLQQVMESVL